MDIDEHMNFFEIFFEMVKIGNVCTFWISKYGVECIILCVDALKIG